MKVVQFHVKNPWFPSSPVRWNEFHVHVHQWILICNNMLFYLRSRLAMGYVNEYGNFITELESPEWEEDKGKHTSGSNTVLSQISIKNSTIFATDFRFVHLLILHSHLYRKSALFTSGFVLANEKSSKYQVVQSECGIQKACSLSWLTCQWKCSAQYLFRNRDFISTRASKILPTHWNELRTSRG